MRAAVFCFVIAVASLLSPLSARGQDRKADFLFGVPRGAIGIRGGYLLASARSDIYEFVGENLTVGQSDFNAPVFGFDLALTLHPRVDVLFGVEVAHAGVDSEYRDFVEDNDAPILQRTQLATVPLNAGFKLYVGPRGREISRFAFIPAKVRPYVGGGASFVWYRFSQIGDFIDLEDLVIFTANLRSEGWGLGAHAFGGADIRITPKVYVSIEARYLWASADLSGDFVGFDPIDLSGLRMTGGINLSF